MKRLVLGLFTCVASGLAFGQIPMPSTTKVAIMELQALAAGTPKAIDLTHATQGYYPTALVHGRCMVGFLGKASEGFDASALNNAHMSWGTRVGNVVSFRVDAYHLSSVNELVGLEYVELAGKAAPNLNRVVTATRADSVHRGINLPQTYTGRDVLIGITDWGFDYTHPMFYDTAMTNYRVRAAWDQYKQAGPAPSAFGYGSEYSNMADLIAAQSDTSNIYSYAYHGSHVAGITAGGGAGTPYRGMAFDAQLLFCTFLVDAAAVLDAFTWMKNVADQDGKRLVINMSWGLYHIGTLDGNSLISQAIDQMAADGVVFVNSGGNNGDVNFHIRKDFTGDTLRSRIQFYPYSANPNMWGQSISMWGDLGADFSAGLVVSNNLNEVLHESPMYNTATQQPYLDSIFVQGNDTIFFNLTAEAAHPLNDRPHFRLRAKNTSGSYRVSIKATAPSGQVHFWNVTELTNDVGNWGQEFQSSQNGWAAGDHFYGISEPACTNGLISVAAYSSEYIVGNGNEAGGAIATFSSFGPTLDERIKPDIAAPGVNVASSMSSFTDASFTNLVSVSFQGNSYPFARLSGTSMASPATAGIAALILEADPQITPADLKQVIMSTARTDANTGVIPAGGSTRWGMGKVNAYHAVAEVLGVSAVAESFADGMMVWPNPVNDALYFRLDQGHGPVTVQVSDITGRLILDRVLPDMGTFTIATDQWSSGVYNIRLQQAGSSVVRKVVKQ